MRMRRNDEGAQQEAAAAAAAATAAAQEEELPCSPSAQSLPGGAGYPPAPLLTSRQIPPAPKYIK
jgi:hypothetical protein